MRTRRYALRPGARSGSSSSPATVPYNHSPTAPRAQSLKPFIAGSSKPRALVRSSQRSQIVVAPCVIGYSQPGGSVLSSSRTPDRAGLIRQHVQQIGVPSFPVDGRTLRASMSRTRAAKATSTSPRSSSPKWRLKHVGGLRLADDAAVGRHEASPKRRAHALRETFVTLQIRYVAEHSARSSPTVLRCGSSSQSRSDPSPCCRIADRRSAPDPSPASRRSRALALHRRVIADEAG